MRRNDLRRTDDGRARVLSRLRHALADLEPNDAQRHLQYLGRYHDWSSGPLHAPPDAGEARAYLDHLLTTESSAQVAFAIFGHFGFAAAALWGAAGTAHIPAVARAARVTAKAPPMDEWERATHAAGRLPAPWRDALLRVIADSRRGGVRLDGTIWSASTVRNVAEALAIWAQWCARAGHDPGCATGTALEAFARDLQAGDRGKPRKAETADPIAESKAQRGTTLRTASAYASRIIAGLGVIEGTAVTPGAEFVMYDLVARADRAGATTKRAAGIVPARTIYRLGLKLFAAAMARPYRGPRAALAARDAVLLVLAAALPQRARALAALSYGTTLVLGSGGEITISLPGRVLKQREGRKAQGGLTLVLHHPTLHRVLSEYRRAMRPVLDGGPALFPSLHRRGGAVTEHRLGVIAGDLTETHLGTRVSIHRIRDCVATEATEALPQGGRIAPALLGHRDPRTTARYYAHAQGTEATRRLRDFLGEDGDRLGLREG